MLLNHFTVFIGVGPNDTTVLLMLSYAYANGVIGTALVILHLQKRSKLTKSVLVQIH